MDYFPRDEGPAISRVHGPFGQQLSPTGSSFGRCHPRFEARVVQDPVGPDRIRPLTCMILWYFFKLTPIIALVLFDLLLGLSNVQILFVRISLLL